MRCIWLTTNWRLDWPSKAGVSTQIEKLQKNELIAMLDKIEQMNINVVFFQVRARGEIMFKSSIEPFSAFISGKSGVSTSYDPLQFAVQECHKRGMECHAWMVCMPLGKNGGNCLSLKKGMITSYKGEQFLEPGHPFTAGYLASVASEIVKNYDVDGLHLDYIRYPDKIKGYPDSKLYSKYGSGMSLEDWRRKNISDIVYAIYDNVKRIKPWVKVSSATLGRLDDIPGMKAYGWNAYNSAYQDVERWLGDGKQDFIVPMMYYNEELFYPYMIDWLRKNNGKAVVPGLGVYRIEKNDSNWDVSEIENQTYFSREFGASGQALYRAKNVLDNQKDIYYKFKNVLYEYPANIPSLIHETGDSISNVEDLKISAQYGNESLTWSKVENAYYYSLYGFDENGKIYLLHSKVTSNYFSFNFLENDAFIKLGVSASDRYNNESDISWIELKQKEFKDYSHCFSKLFYDNNRNVLSLEDFSKYTSISIQDVGGNICFRDQIKSDKVSLSLSKGFYRVQLSLRDGKIENKWFAVE
ncbi:MAG: family 10 glycosylhydrolase [Bacteroidales bacterium]|nr:family 10 glycosylhydrolase [Bacteroidales bacterium]